MVSALVDSLQAITAAAPKHDGSNADDPSKGIVRTDSSGTGSDGTTESPGTAQLGGMVVNSDKPLLTGNDEPAGDFGSPSTARPSKYSRKDLDTHDVFWTCSLEEFHAMSHKQWASFGTAFYIAPDGFDSATKHVIQLE